MDIGLIIEHLPLFFEGVWTTLSLVGLSLLCGLSLAIPLALVQAYDVPVLGRMAGAYCYMFRGTPMLVQLYIIYYGLAQFDFIRESLAWYALSSAYFCAFLSFTLNSAAYVAEIYRGAIVNLDKGEIEAAVAYGMSRSQAIRLIVLPQAMRNSLPAYSNEVIFLIHASVIASTITIIDILGAGRKLNASYYVVYEGFLTAAVFYLVIVMIISLIFRKLEARLLAHRA